MVLDPHTPAVTGWDECQEKEAEVQGHPPAPGGHIQEELHKRQEVVVVIRHQAQGTAQLPELWGHRCQGRRGMGSPSTLSSPPAPFRRGGVLVMEARTRGMIPSIPVASWPRSSAIPM